MKFIKFIEHNKVPVSRLYVASVTIIGASLFYSVYVENKKRCETERRMNNLQRLFYTNK